MVQAHQFVVDDGHPCLPGHFPGNPVVPGVLILDEVLVGLACVVYDANIKIDSVKFFSLLRPGERAIVHYELLSGKCGFRVLKAGSEIQEMIAQGTLSWAVLGESR